jgi:hypothetical protein
VRHQQRRPGSVPPPDLVLNNVELGEDTSHDEADMELGEDPYVDTKDSDTEKGEDTNTAPTVESSEMPAESDSPRSHRPRHDPDRLNFHTFS